MLLLAGCGLENVPLLSQPGSPGAAGTIFQFKKLPENGDLINEPGFRGYEIYYKIYGSGTIPSDNNIQDIDELKNKFFRLTEFNVIVLPSPLISIAAADFGLSFVIFVDFSGDIGQDPDYLTIPAIYPVALSPDTPSQPAVIIVSPFRRQVTPPGLSETKYFKDFASTDADIDADIYQDILEGNAVNIAAYVVSYGVDSSFGAIYSIPKYLGYISLILPHL